MKSDSIRRASYRDLERIADFLELIFPQDDRRYYQAFAQYDPWFDPELIWWVEAEGKVVSTAWTIPRVFERGDRRFWVAGLANIATAEAFRGRGLAAALIDRVMQDAERLNVDFLILVTEIPRFYERWGFREVGSYCAHLPACLEENKGQVAPISENEVTEGARAFYRRFSLTAPLRNQACFRGLQEWNRWSSLFRAGTNTAEWKNVTAEGSSASLGACVLERNDTLDVLEAFWGEGLEASQVRGLLGALGGDAGKPVRLRQHLSVIKWLHVIPSRIDEAVMVKPRREISCQSLYWPVSDYF